MSKADFFGRIKSSPRPRRACLLMSGGVDSSVLAVEALAAGIEVCPAYVRCGFSWENAELWWLKRLLRRIKNPKLKPLAVLDAPMREVLRGHWSLTGRRVPGPGREEDRNVLIPGRNLILFSQAGVYCGRRNIPWILSAILKGNPFPDATPRFFKAMERAMGTALGSTVGIAAPYRRLSKVQIAARVPDFPFKLAFSCLNPRGLEHCGRCNKCEERGWVL
ncbi:MAG: 7-cyano-7-deazaguanine synthase [Elusimicrobiota bacterium]